MGATNIKHNRKSITSWKTAYYKALRAFVNQVAPRFPEQVECPVTFRSTMYEMGGSFSDRGIAIIVSDPYGYPIPATYLNSRKNEYQAEGRVWPGCLVFIGSHVYGKESFAIYRIAALPDTHADRNTFGMSTLELISCVTPQSKRMDQSVLWYEHLTEEIPMVEHVVTKLRDKLYSTSNTIPTHIEWYMDYKAEALNLRSAFFRDGLEWQPAGLIDRSTEHVVNCESFQELYEKTVKESIHVFHESEDVVFAVFGHYFAQINEHGAWLPILSLSDDGELPSGTRLITEARVVHAAEYTKHLKLYLSDTVFVYRHNDVRPDVRIDKQYTVQDASVSAFRKIHSGTYSNTILPVHPYAMIDGSEERLLANHGVNPSTFVRIGLFSGSKTMFFSDLKRKEND